MLEQIVILLLGVYVICRISFAGDLPWLIKLPAVVAVAVLINRFVVG